MVPPQASVSIISDLPISLGDANGTDNPACRLARLCGYEGFYFDLFGSWSDREQP